MQVQEMHMHVDNVLALSIIMLGVATPTRCAPIGIMGVPIGSLQSLLALW